MTAPRCTTNLAYTPQMIDCSGQFVVPSNATTPNMQVQQANLTVGTYGVSQLTPTANISPQQCLFQFFCTPNAAAAQPATNGSRLPAGTASGAQTAGSEFLVDATGFPCDIISCVAGITTPGRGAQTLDCVVSAIDNVNKLIYLQVVGWTNGTPTAAPVGSVITFQFVMKDSAGT